VYGKRTCSGYGGRLKKDEVIEKIVEGIDGGWAKYDLTELLHAFFDLAAEEGRKRAADDANRIARGDYW
jgi:hypothetical protein